MTKWICNGCAYNCIIDVKHGALKRCLISTGYDPMVEWNKICTTEERSSAVFDAFAGVDNRVCHLEKKVQELERELKNHYHDTGFPK
jgi:hypothetical protein